MNQSVECPHCNSKDIAKFSSLFPDSYDEYKKVRCECNKCGTEFTEGDID